MFDRPIVCAAVLWVIGAGLAFSIGPLGIPWIVCLVAVGLAGFCWSRSSKKLKLLACLLLVMVSLGYNQWYDGRNITAIHEEWHESEVEVSGVIKSTVKVDGDQVSFTLDVNSLSHPMLSEIVSLEESIQVFVRLSDPGEKEQASKWERGDHAKLSGMLRKPAAARNFGAFDYRAYLYYQHIHWQLSVSGGSSVKVKSVPRKPWVAVLHYNDRLRERLGAVLDRAFPGEQAGFMKGMLVGVRSDLDPEQFKQFSQLGLTHILAISGLHVGIFVSIILAVSRLSGMTRESGILLAMLLLPLYILVTGSAPSVMRAGIMALIGLHLFRKRRLKDSLNLVCLIGLGMLIWNPYYLVNISFQMSFIVTIGLILGVPRFNRLLPQRFGAVTAAFSVTMVAQFASFPLSIYYFNQFSLLSWLANFVIIPIYSAAVIPLGTAVLILGSVSAPLAALPAWLANWLNRFSFWLVDWLSGWDVFHLIFPTPAIWWIVSYYGLCGLGLHLSVHAKERRIEALSAPAAAFGYRGADPLPGWRAVSAVGAVFLLLLFHGYEPNWWQRTGSVYFMDVGQGDAIYIRTPNGKHMLIDGGGTFHFRREGEEWKERASPYEVGEKAVVPLLKKRGVHHIDWLIITHADFDHIGGLQAVLEHIPVKHILFNGTWKDNETSRQLIQTALKKMIPLFAVHKDQSLRIDRHTVLHFLYPAPLSPSASVWEDSQNDRSLVFLMEMHQARLLFSGDIEKPGEADILYSFKEGSADQDSETFQANITNLIPVDVLKVAHHGSKTSTTEEWLAYWKPVHAMISAGVNNRYGHPSAEVTSRIEEFGASLYRTDLQGEIWMQIHRKGYRIQTVDP
ncbi:ComEC/Rec2 family competence protein [Paenibacillus senegalensis]|uniref:ComEC/Rec2 family competence protein n=1 Tax=Paenibacillus senegalensis TaxID=1465766 RepID=UPI000287AD2E|nr:ComEC/Rec2 family competence protein [Paenibacillus senegalensis]